MAALAMSYQIQALESRLPVNVLESKLDITGMWLPAPVNEMERQTLIVRLIRGLVLETVFKHYV